MKKKKIIFFTKNLDVGGIETSLLNLINNIDDNIYDITLFLDNKKGNFLSKLKKHIKVIEYNNTGTSILSSINRRIKNRYWKYKLKNKYDYSFAYYPYISRLNNIALSASKNNYIWVHGNLLGLFNHDKEQVLKKIKKYGYTKFNNIVFVSKDSKKAFFECVDFNKNSYILNNMIFEVDSNIKKKIKKNKEIIFLNVARHDEKEKKISRLINASYILAKEYDNFHINLVGDGPDHYEYIHRVKELGLEKYITFYNDDIDTSKYYVDTDAFILCSDYEGYGIVLLESIAHGCPVITTNVSDVMHDISGRYGLVCDAKTEYDLYLTMKKFIKEGFVIKEKFDVKKHNNKIINNFYDMIK